MLIMAETKLIAPAELAEAVARALLSGDQQLADRLIPEAVDRILRGPDAESTLAAVAGHPASTGDARYDALIAASLQWALARRGLPAAEWMEQAPTLSEPWLWDSNPEPSEAFRRWIEARTPKFFLERGLLLREADLGVA